MKSYPCPNCGWRLWPGERPEDCTNCHPELIEKWRREKQANPPPPPDRRNPAVVAAQKRAEERGDLWVCRHCWGTGHEAYESDPTCRTCGGTGKRKLEANEEPPEYAAIMSLVRRQAFEQVGPFFGYPADWEAGIDWDD